jgi:hypothetical protein
MIRDNDPFPRTRDHGNVTRFEIGNIAPFRQLIRREIPNRPHQRLAICCCFHNNWWRRRGRVGRCHARIPRTFCRHTLQWLKQHERSLFRHVEFDTRRARGGCDTLACHAEKKHDIYTKNQTQCPRHVTTQGRSVQCMAVYCNCRTRTWRR